MTIANLGLAVDSSQVTSATKALDNLTAAAKPAAQAADQSWVPHIGAHVRYVMGRSRDGRDRAVDVVQVGE